MSKDDIETQLESIIGSMAIEGITLSDEDIARCKGVLEGTLDADEEDAKLFAKYRAIAEQDKLKRGVG